MAVASCLGLLLVMMQHRFRPGVAGVLLGLLSCLPRLDTPKGQTLSEDRITVAEIGMNIRRSVPGRVTFDAVDLLDPEHHTLSAQAVELPWRNAALLEPGDVVWLRGHCESVIRPLNPQSFEGWLWRRGITEECSVRYVSKPLERRYSGVLYPARWALRERVEDLAPERRGAMVLLSMALGYRDVLSEPVERAFSRLGLTHLLVVSGYQVSMVFALAYASVISAAGTIGGGRHGRRIVACVALTAAVVYVAFIGAEMSATRALIAATCLCLESLLEGAKRFAQRWGVALLTIQLLWPWALFEIGVQLTFAALAGIGIGSVIAGHGKIRSLLLIQLSVWALTSTIVSAWSGIFSWSGLLLNITVAPLWSAFNCTVGLLALLASCGHLWGSSLLLEGVMRLNEALVGILLNLSDSWAGGIEVSGYMRCATVACLAVLSGALAFEAAQRRRAFEMCRLAR